MKTNLFNKIFNRKDVVCKSAMTKDPYAFYTSCVRDSSGYPAAQRGVVADSPTLFTERSFSEAEGQGHALYKVVMSLAIICSLFLGQQLAGDYNLMAQPCDSNTCTQICAGSLVTFDINTIPRPNSADYGLIYFLTDANDNVIEATADLGGLAPGSSYTFSTLLADNGALEPYEIHAVSYNLSDPPVPLIPAAGANLSTIGSTSLGCFEWGENGNHIAELCITVNPVPPVLTHTLTACESSYGSMTASFTLTDADATLGAAGTYAVSYHQTKIEALTNTNPVSGPYVSGTTTLYARVGNSSTGCISISTLNLAVTRLLNADFSISGFCAPGPGTAPAAVVSGGSYSSTTATIDATTGVITGAVAGTTYDVTYTTTVNGCTNSITKSVLAYDCNCTPAAKCVGDPLCASDGVYSPPAGYTQLYVLTDASGVIVAMNTTGTFPSEFLTAAPTLYNIHTLVYNTTNAPVSLPSVGANISTVGSTTKGCYNDNFIAEKVCYTLNPKPLAATLPVNGRYCSSPGTVVPISVADPGAGFMIDWYADAAGTIPATGTLGPNGSSITLDGTSPALPPSGGTVVVYARVRNLSSGCVSSTLVAVSLTNVPADDADFTIAGFCSPGSSSLAVVTGVLGGTFSLVSSTAPGTIVVDPVTGRITGATGPGIIEVNYQTSGECPANVTKSINALDCPCPAFINICQGDPLCTTSTTPATDPYRLIYYLTDVNGVIQAISTTYTPTGTPITNQFTGVLPGDGYKVYILSYYNGFFPYDVTPTVGSLITDNLGDNSPCYNADFLSDYYCYNVKPQPYAEPTGADLCYTTVNSTVTLLGNPSAANTFTWAIASAGTTGATAADLTTPNSQDLILDYTGLTEGTLHLTYTISHTITPDCEKVYDVYVNINQLLANPTNQTVCQGFGPATVPGNPTGGIGTDQTHSWVITDPGTTGAASGNLTNTSTNTVTVATAGLTPGVISLAYTYTDTSSGCTITEPATVTIRPTPVLTLTTPGTVCESASVVTFTATPAPSIPATGTFSTTASAGFTDNGDGTASLDPALSGDGTFTVTYSYNDGFGCTATITKSITITPNPVPAITGPATLCINEFPIQFTGSPNVPTAGTFTASPGVVFTQLNGLATVTAAPAGTNYMYYSYTDINGCTGRATATFVVYDISNAAFTIADFCYPGPGPAAVPVTPPASGYTYVYSILTPIIEGTTIDPTTGVISGGASNTTYTIQLTLTNPNGCVSTATDQVKVNQLPVVSLNDPIDECYNSTTNFEFVASPVAGSFTISPATAAFVPNNAAGTAVLDPNTATQGTTYTITYSYTDGNSCTSSISQQVYVIPATTVNFTFANFCVPGTAPYLPTGITPAGGTFEFDEVPIQGGTLNPLTGELTNVAIGTYKIKYISPSGCDAIVKNVVVTSCCAANAPNIILPTTTTTNTDGNMAEACLGTEVAAFSSIYANGEVDPGVDYATRYILADASGEIIEFNATGDFITASLAAGTYSVYVLSYNTTAINTPPSVDTYLTNLDAAQSGGDITALVANDSDTSSLAGTAPGGGAFCLDLANLDNDGADGVSEVVRLVITSLPVVAPAATTNVCQGETVAINGMPSGGRLPYTHSWTDTGTGTATGYSLANTTTQIVTVDAGSATPGTIILNYQVTDALGCMAEMDVTVTVRQLPVISSQPSPDTACAGTDASFSVTTTAPTDGGTYAYQWQQSIDGGVVWTNVGTNSGSLTVTAVTASMNGYLYRVMITNGHTPDPDCVVISSSALLTVNAPNCGSGPWNGSN